MDLGPTAVSRELKRLWQKTHIYMIWMNYIIESPYSSIHPTSNIKILLLIIHGHPRFPIFF